MSTLAEVYSELQNNPLFQKEFQKDPIRALKAFHFELSDAEIKKIGLMQKTHQKDGQLDIDLERRTSE